MSPERIDASFPNEPLIQADILNTVGRTYLGVGAYEPAINFLERSAALILQNLGPEHPDTLGSMSSLATAYQAAGKRDQALPLFEETLKLQKAKFGPKHPDTLKCMNNLALAYRDAGKLDRALPLFEETNKLMKAKFGPEHPDTLKCMNNLAAAYQAVGKLDRALPLFEETIKLQKAKFGPEHPETLISMNNLVVAYSAAGEIDEALRLSEETLKLQKAKFGPEHPETLKSMNNLAVAYWQEKQLDKSILLFEEVLRLQKAKLGPLHPDTLNTAVNLGMNYKDAGRVAEALPLLEEGYRAAKKYPSLRGVGNQLWDGYVRAGRTKQAAALAKELLADARLQLPKESPQLAGQLAAVAMSLLYAKALTEAESLLRECLAIREKVEPNAWTTFSTKSMLGAALSGQKKYPEAEPLLLAGYEGMKQREAKIPAAGKLRLTEALEHLIQHYEILDKKEEAAKWRKELEARKGALEQTKLDKPRLETSSGAQGK